VNKSNTLNRKKIWIISELFYPDEASTGYIMTCIAKSIAQDHDVHVICGPIGYDKLVDSRDENFEFCIHRIKALNFNKNNIVGRLIRLIALSFRMFLKAFSSIKKNDTVFIVTNPAFVIPLFAVIKIIKQNKLIILVHDVFPENLISSKIIYSIKNPVYKLTKSVFDWSYCQANLLIVLGVDMLDIIQKKTHFNHPVVTIENWANTEEINPHPFSSNTLINKYGFHDKFVFTFAGNLGRVQGLEFIFKIIKKIKNPKVHFIFIGSGALFESLNEEIKQQGITSVTFTGPLSRDQQNVFLNAAHFGLVTLSSELYGLGVPSKTYNIMAAGKPILFIGHKKSEIARMVTEENCGFVFDDNEEIEILRFFNEIDEEKITEAENMGIRARKLAETKYSQPYILNKFKQIVNNC
jgi:glycosyltransferase involved in cell wall biosynthesis